jgi:LysM repeat protein
LVKRIARILPDGRLAVAPRKYRWERKVLPYISPVRRNRARYRRRRVGALVVAAALATGVYAGGLAGAESQPTHYTVAPGDTLWGIAIEHTAVWEDPRPKVEAIREANDLSGYEIYPGMSLKLPSTL